MSHERPHVEKGDAIVITEHLEVEERRNAKNEAYFTAIIPYSFANKKSKPPFMIFDSIVGIYIGMKYVPTRQARRGIVQSAQHGFLFGDREIFIDPKYIKVVSRFVDSMG